MHDGGEADIGINGVDAGLLWTESAGGITEARPGGATRGAHVSIAGKEPGITKNGSAQCGVDIGASRDETRWNRRRIDRWRRGRRGLRRGRRRRRRRRLRRRGRSLGPRCRRWCGFWRRLRRWFR